MALPVTPFDAEVSYSVGSGFAVTADDTQARQTNSLPFQCTCSPRFSFFDCDEDVVTGGNERPDNTVSSMIIMSEDKSAPHKSAATAENEAQTVKNVEQVNAARESMRQGHTRHELSSQPLHKQGVMPLQSGSFEDTTNCMQESQETAVMRADEQYDENNNITKGGGVEVSENDGYEEGQVVCCSADLPAHLRRFMTNNNNINNMGANLLASTGAQSGTSCTTPCPLSPAAASAGVTPQLPYVELGADYGKAYMNNSRSGNMTSHSLISYTVSGVNGMTGGCSGVFVPSASYSNATLTATTTNNGNNGNGVTTASYDAASASYAWTSGVDFNGEGGTAEYCSPMVLMTTTPSVSSWMCAAASPTTTTTQQNMNTNNNTMTSTPQPQSTREEYVQPCEMTITGLMSGSQDYYSNSGSNGVNIMEEKGSRTSSPVTNAGAKAGRKSHTLALHPADFFAVPSPAAQHQHQRGNHHHHHLSPGSNASRVSFSHHVDPSVTGTPSQDMERPLPYQGQAPMPLSPSLLTQSRPQSRATNMTSDLGQSGLDDLTDNADEEIASEEGDAVRSGMKEQNTMEEDEKNGVVRHETSAATTTGTFMSNSATTGGLSHEAARSITSSNRSRAMSATSCTNTNEARRREMSTTDRLTLSRCGGATIHIEPTVNVSAPASDPVSRTVRQAQGTPEWTAGTRGWLSGRNEDQTYTNTSTLSIANNNNNTPTLTPPSAIGKESGGNSSVGSLTPGMSSQGRGNTTTLTTTTTNTMNPAATTTPGVFVTPSAHGRSDKTSPITSTPLPDSQSDLALPSPMNVRTISSAFLQAPPPTTQENTPLYTAFSRSSLSESSPATMSAMMSTGLWLPCSPPFTVPPTADNTTTTTNTNASLVNARARLVLSDPTMSNAPTSTTATSAGVTMPTYYQSFATGQALNLPTSEAMARNATTAITTPQGCFMYSGAEGGLLSGGGNNMPLYMTSASPMSAGYAPISAAPTTDSYVVSSAPSGGLVKGQTFGFSFPAPSYLVSAQDSALPTATNNNNNNASLGNNVNPPHFATHITSAGIKAPFSTSTTTSSVSNAMPPTSSSSPSFSFAAASINAANQANCNAQGRESSYTNSTAVSYPPLSHYVVGENGLFYFSQSSNTNNTNGTVEAANKSPEENSNTAPSALNNHSSPARSDSMQRNETPRLLVIGSASNPSIHRRWSNVHGALIGSARYVPYNESAEPALTTIITAVNLQDFASRVLVEPCGLNNTNNNAYNVAQLATLQNTLASLNPWCRAAIVHDFLSKQSELACNVNASALDPHSKAILDALGATVVHRELSAQEQAMTSYLISNKQHTNTNNTNAAGNDNDMNGMGGYATAMRSFQHNNNNEEQESVNAMLRALSSVSPTANSQHHSHHHAQHNTNEAENRTMPCMVVGTKVITSAYASQAAGDAATLAADGSNHFHHHHSNTSSALANAQIVPIFVQMFPCELHDRMTILNHVIAKTCGPEAGVVVGLEFRSETSFIALVRTSSVWWLIYQLRCRILMDRHGFWYAENMEQYLRMKLYCEAVRRLPQQIRHFQTDGLPCMPLVVELSRSVDPMRVIGSPAPQCFDEVVPISSLDRRGARVYHSHPQQPRMMRI